MTQKKKGQKVNRPDSHFLGYFFIDEMFKYWPFNTFEILDRSISANDKMGKSRASDEYM